MEIIKASEFIPLPWAIGIIALMVLGAALMILSATFIWKIKIFLVILITGVLVFGSGVVVSIKAPHYFEYTVDVSDFGRDIPDIYRIVKKKSDHVYVIRLKEDKD